MGKYLIVIGILIVAAGLLWPWLSKIPWFRLPGDIVMGGENFRVFLPITTLIVINVVIWGVLWLVNRFWS